MQVQSRDFLQFGLFLGVLLVLAKPVGFYLLKVLHGERNFLSRVMKPVEDLIYKMTGTHPNVDQHWTRYASDLLVFSAVTSVFTYLILRFQYSLPPNPQKMENLSWDLNFNTTLSFLTNTNWQSYAGESTLSYFAQMVGLTFQNFISPAVGLCVSFALIRGLIRKESQGVGNFWADLVRSLLYILLPLAVIFSIALVSQGVIQNFQPYREVTTLEGVKQVVPQGPVASQVAIKMAGTNGGGFFNTNSAHPYENPTPLSNFLQMIAVLLIPSSFVYLLGASTKNKKHGWSVWSAMAILFVVGSGLTVYSEFKGNPLFSSLGCSSPANMEGKETRFGIFSSALFGVVTTATSCGAVNSMHDSYTPLGSFVFLVNMLLGEVVFGGIGSGIATMVIFIILTVFIAGLMVGRTPEYLGKKIEGREVKYSMLVVIITAFLILGFSAIGMRNGEALKSLGNTGTHGFSEILYAYTSATANNGSALGGLSSNTLYWNVTLALAMFFGRFFLVIPVLGIAGSMAAKRTRPESVGSFPVHGPLFITLLLGVIVIVGALTFLPALSLGPILEHFQMRASELT